MKIIDHNAPLVSHEARHIKMIRERLVSWEDEFRTNKHGMAQYAEKHVVFWKKELLRFDG